MDSCSPKESTEQGRSWWGRAVLGTQSRHVTRLDTELSSPRPLWMPQCTPILPRNPAVLGPFWSLIFTKEGHSKMPIPALQLLFSTHLFPHQQQNCKGPCAGRGFFRDMLCLGLLQSSDILKGIFQASQASLEPNCISQSGQT